MTITVRTTATKGVPMDSMRKTALVAGVFYLITIIPAPIAAFALYGPVLNHADYIVSSGADTRVLWGGFLEVIVALACIGVWQVPAERAPVVLGGS